jgi:hypothetical protein
MLEVHIKVFDPSTHAFLLKKLLNGLEKAGSKWWKKFKEAMTGCNCFPSKSNHSLST